MVPFTILSSDSSGGGYLGTWVLGDGGWSRELATGETWFCSFWRLAASLKNVSGCNRVSGCKVRHQVPENGGQAGVDTVDITQYTRNMDVARRLPDSTIVMLVESLSAYSVGSEPNRVGTLTVFGEGGQLVGAIDVRDQANPSAVSKEDANRVMETAGALIQTATSFGSMMKFIKVSYNDKKLLVIPGEQYVVAAVIDSTQE